MRNHFLALAALMLLGGLLVTANVQAERPAKVLLITDDSLAKAWQPLADWKTRQGKPTKIVTIAEINKNYDGKDIQQKIQACVLQHIDKQATKWVVLGGDSGPEGKGLVPDRDTKHPQFRYADIPTDLYYISDKSWDANDDNVYGDWDDDREAVAYSHGGACIGRIPVRTADDVKAYTEKVIAYESQYPTEGFARQMIYTCPERMAYPKLNTSKETIATAWSEGKLEQFFANKSPWDDKSPGDHDLSPDNWAKMINDGAAAKMHIHGHGLLPVWVLEGNKTVGKETVDKLSNDNAYPVITTVSCFTGHYDARQDPSITELMLRRPRSGAIAIVAPSREGVPVFADPNDFRKMITEGKMDGTTRLLTDFWTQAMKHNLTTGEALAAAKANMAEDAEKHAGYHWCLCELNLLGDPTLDLRSADPKTPTLELAEKLSAGKQRLTVKSNAAGADVCLWQGDDLYKVVQTDQAGNATLEVETRPGKLLVTVSGPNLNTVTRDIMVGQ